MTRLDDERLRVVQIACGSFHGDDGTGSYTLYALTEDGRIWSQSQSLEWDEEPPIPDQRSQWQRRKGER